MKLRKRLNFKKGLRAKRTRIKIRGTASRPRLSIFRSNKFIYAQLVDDEQGKTLISASDKEMINGIQGKRPAKLERARELGKLIAQKAKSAKIESAVFDRGSYPYHGRVRMTAEGAREAGLKI